MSDWTRHHPGFTAPPVGRVDVCRRFERAGLFGFISVWFDAFIVHSHPDLGDEGWAIRDEAFRCHGPLDQPPTTDLPDFDPDLDDQIWWRPALHPSSDDRYRQDAERSCATCRHSVPVLSDRADEGPLLECRRYPPILLVTDGCEVLQAFPNATQPCGEWSEP